MNTSESTSAISKALVAFQAEITNPGKDATGQVGSRRYKYTSLPNLVDHIRKKLASHGMAVIQSVETDERGWVGCTTRIIHDSGEWIESAPLTLPLGNKEDAQGGGIACTYSRRYSLAAMLNLAPDDDDDAASISGGKVVEGKEFTNSVFEGYWYGVFRDNEGTAEFHKSATSILAEVRKTKRWTDPKNKIAYDVTDPELDRVGKSMARQWKK